MSPICPPMEQPPKSCLPPVQTAEEWTGQPKKSTVSSASARKICTKHGQSFIRYEAPLAFSGLCLVYPNRSYLTQNPSQLGYSPRRTANAIQWRYSRALKDKGISAKVRRARAQSRSLARPGSSGKLPRLGTFRPPLSSTQDQEWVVISSDAEGNGDSGGEQRDSTAAPEEPEIAREIHGSSVGSGLRETEKDGNEDGEDDKNDETEDEDTNGSEETTVDYGRSRVLRLTPAIRYSHTNSF